MSGEVLTGVSATALYTLRNRAVEAMRPDSPFRDAEAVRLYRRIDYDFGRFGRPSQAHALRARTYDRALREYLTTHPAATVVALGEGLQTTYWRLGRPAVDWLSVDMATVTDLRRRLLPAEPRITTLAASVLDRTWMDHVDGARGVFITAEGLFMYLDRASVMSLVADCARRFPGGRLIFDSIPAWYSRLTLRGLRPTRRYTAPPMPFSLSVSEAARLPGEVDGVASAVDVMPPPGRRRWRSRTMRGLANLPRLRDHRPAVTLLTFAAAPPKLV